MRLFRFLKSSDSDKIQNEAAMSAITAASFWRHLLESPEYQRATKAERKEFLLFLIEIIKQDLAVHAASGLLAQEVEQAVTLFPIEELGSRKDKIPFEGNTVVARAYRRSSFFPAILHISGHGLLPQLNPTTGFYIPEWKLILIKNGIHHAAAASILRCRVEAECEVVQVQNVLKNIGLSEDMHRWKLADGRKMNVVEPRIALLYAISRELNELDSIF